MASVNRVTLIGNVGKAPEIRFMPNGEAVANFSIATTEQWKDKNGNKQEATEWHRIVAYRKLAEIIGEYVKKGTSLYVEGRIVSNKYTDKQGIERIAFQIQIETIRLLGSPSNSSSASQGEYGGADNTASSTDPTDFDAMKDDIPF